MAGRVVIFILMVGAVAGFSGESRAGQFTLTPSLSVRGTYDDNIYFSRRDETSDFLTEVKPSLAFKAATEIYALDLAAAMNFQSFADETNLNTVDQDYTAAVRLQLHPRFKVNLDGSYLRDTTLNEELLAGGLVLTRNDRNKYGGSAGFTWTAGERTELDLGTSYQRADYKDPDFTDYYAESIYGSIGHRLRNYKTVAVLQPSYSYYKFDTGNTRNYQALAGLQHEFTERSSLQILAGPNYSRSEFSAIRVAGVLGPFIFLERTHQVDSQSGWVANIEAKRTYETGDVRAGYTQDITGSGYGETLRRSHPYAAISLRLSERLRAGLNLDYFRIKTDREEALRNYETWSVSPNLRYMLGERAEVTLYYRYSKVNDRLDGQAERNMIYLQIRLYTVKEL